MKCKFRIFVWAKLDIVISRNTIPLSPVHHWIMRDQSVFEHSELCSFNQFSSYIISACIIPYSLNPGKKFFSKIMVLKLDSKLDIAARVRSNLGVLIWLRHLFRSRAVTNLIFLKRKKQISFIYEQHVLSYHLI